MGKNDYEYYILASTKNQMGFSEEALDFIERGLLLNDRSAILLGLKAYIVGQQNPAMAMEEKKLVKQSQQPTSSRLINWKSMKPQKNWASFFPKNRDSHH